MKVARHWAIEKIQTRTPDGKPILLGVWEWSSNSLQEAKERARDSARRVARHVEVEGFKWRNYARTYGYEDKPPREEIVEEIRDARGETIATISCNAYGALILNTASMMFIDVDIPAEPTFGWLTSLIAKLSGKKIETQAEKIEKKIIELTTRHSGLRFRVYRTAAGFRCVATGRVIEPTSENAQRLFVEFEADPLYVRLTKNQECYRARLTPKPWRVKCLPPPSRFPWSSLAEEQKYRQWQQEYSRLSQSAAVCRRVDIGSNSQGASVEIENLLRLHDRYTKAESTLPLA